MEVAHRLGRNQRRGRRLRLRALEQEAHVLIGRWCREPDFDGHMKRPEHMDSLPIIPIAHNNYIGPTGGWDLKTRKGASDFGCLKDKWARFGYKSGFVF
jgi:hypothetical protein